MITFLQRKHVVTFSISLLYACNILCMESILPLSIGKYRIQSPQERNSIITDLNETYPDGMVYLLYHLSHSSFSDINFFGHTFSDKESIGHITNIYSNLGLNQSIFFMQLIGQFVCKTNRLSSEIVAFINDRRKVYHCTDKDENIDKTGNFLKAFDDAKSRFFYLPKIQIKILCLKPITQNEYAYVLKNMHLRDWSNCWSQCYVIRSFFERFHEAGIIKYGYAEFLGEATVGTISTLYFESSKTSILIGTIIGFLTTSIATVYHANTGVRRTQKRNIPWKFELIG
jgi:hypothetical protein